MEKFSRAEIEAFEALLSSFEAFEPEQKQKTIWGKIQNAIARAFGRKKYIYQTYQADIQNKATLWNVGSYIPPEKDTVVGPYRDGDKMRVDTFFAKPEKLV
jgi:hypothetical protein